MFTLIYNIAFVKLDLGYYWPAWLIGVILLITVIIDAVLIGVVLSVL